MRSKFVVSVLFGLALALAACGPAPTAAPTAMPVASATAVMPVTGASTSTAMASSGASGGAATVMLGQNATLGSFLVDSKGMTLYLFTNDTAGKSNCNGGCLSNWPPLLTNGAPVAGDGVTASMLGTITRSDGTTQVTYNGWPLYYFIGDKAAGDTKGENVANSWYVMTPAGTQK